jgi:hypothetical protein
MHLMELLGDVGQVESCIGPFGHNVSVGARLSVGARQVHGLRQKHHRLRNYFGCTRWYS